MTSWGHHVKRGKTDTWGPREIVYGILHQAYQRDVEMLRELDDTFFHPGEYVYERTKDAISHCQEHMQELVLSPPLMVGVMLILE